jgi:hypothetical protein
LDGYYPGYGSGKIDLDETTQEWIDKVTGGVTIPEKDCREEVEKALQIQEGEYMVKLEIAKKDAYNKALEDSGDAIAGLAK